MTRVSTLTLQNTLVNSLQSNQASLADANLQLSTTKKVQDYAALGGNTARVLSASSMLAQQKAQSTVADRVNTTLGFYDTALNSIDSTASDLKTKLLKAIGDDDGSDLGSTIQSAFDAYRTALNTTEAGVPIFAGGQTGSAPFKPQSLSDLAGLASPTDAFGNDNTHMSARLSENTDMQYGINASDMGTGLVEAFTTLNALGPFGDKLTDAQTQGLNQVMAQIDSGLAGVRAANGRNGDLQNQVETLGKRADDRSNLLTGVIGDAVDADLGQVATDISNRTTILSASYSAFDKLNNLSLLNYLSPN